MAYDMVKFERGQVWMVRGKLNAVGHEQNKDRPWLVLSVGKFNSTSGMITCAPITSRNSTVSPAQVIFTNDKRQLNVILCEQIRTFDYRSGAYIFDFMGNLSDEVLEKVDVALSIHLGMHYSPITLNKLYDSMEAIIKSVGHMQKEANTPKFTDEDVYKFAEKLQSLSSIPTASDEVSASKEVEESISTTCTSTFTHEIGPVVDVETGKRTEKVETESPKKERIKWTTQMCEEFLKDCDTLPMKKVMEKWAISKKTRYYSMKNYARNLLTKEN